MACLSWKRPGVPARILHHTDAKPTIREWLQGKDVLCAHNTEFDMAVICAAWPDLTELVFRAYDSDRVTCTKRRAQLLAIADGSLKGYKTDDGKWIKSEFSLEALARNCLGKKIEKEDTYRLRYGELINIPVRDWPQEAVDYSLGDVETGLELYEWQEQQRHNRWEQDLLADQYRQARAYFALHLSSCWGMRTRAEGVRDFAAGTQEEYEETKARLVEAGLVRADGSRNMAAARARMEQACKEEGIEPILTDGGKSGNRQIALDHDSCDFVSDPIIEAYSAYQTLAKVIANDIPMLEKGTVHPVHPSYNLADTGRTTCRGPNIQNLRRKKGIREAFVPRPGKVFILCDYDGLELHALGQACLELFGHSRLAEMLNSGQDPHSQVAATILGITYEEACKRKEDKTDEEFQQARQTGKVVNFGCPVGLGAKSLVDYARKTYQVVLTEAKAYELKQIWLHTMPEMGDYFRYVSELTNTADGTCIFEQLYVGRIRGGGRFTSTCSTISQGLGADAAKSGFWSVARACYSVPSSPLYGSRPVAFVHDEICAETDDGPGAHAAAQELGRLMREGADIFLKDCPTKCEPLLARFWSKKAKALYKDGQLVPWNGE